MILKIVKTTECGKTYTYRGIKGLKECYHEQSPSDCCKIESAHGCELFDFEEFSFWLAKYKDTVLLHKGEKPYFLNKIAY